MASYFCLGSMKLSNENLNYQNYYFIISVGNICLSGFKGTRPRAENSFRVGIMKYPVIVKNL